MIGFRCVRLFFNGCFCPPGKKLLEEAKNIFEAKSEATSGDLRRAFRLLDDAVKTGYRKAKEFKVGRRNEFKVRGALSCHSTMVQNSLLPSIYIVYIIHLSTTGSVLT